MQGRKEKDKNGAKVIEQRSALQPLQKILLSAITIILLLLVVRQAMDLSELSQRDNTEDDSGFFFGNDSISGDSIFDNSSFESDPFGRLSVWELATRGTDMVSVWSDEQANRGDYSLMMTTSTGANQGWAGWFTSIDFDDDVTYTISAYALSLDGASGWLSINFLNDDGGLVVGFSTGCPQPNDGEWQPYILSITPEAHAEYDDIAEVRFGVQQCLSHREDTSTTLYMDDVVVTAD